MFLWLFRVARYAVAWLDLVIWTVGMTVLAMFPRRLVEGVYPKLFWSWCRVFVRALGVRLFLHQKNARPLPERYLLVANHPSAFEDVGIPALFDVYSLAKHEVADWWVVGRIAKAAGTLFVERESAESRHQAAESIAEALLEGKNVALYPEGGCKGRRIADQFKYGAFDISLRTGIPILPVFIHYEAQDEFEWRPGQTLLHKIWHFMTATNPRANYYVYDAIDPGDFPDKETYTAHVYDCYLRWQSEYLE